MPRLGHPEAPKAVLSASVLREAALLLDLGDQLVVEQRLDLTGQMELLDRETHAGVLRLADLAHLCLLKGKEVAGVAIEA